MRAIQVQVMMLTISLGAELVGQPSEMDILDRDPSAPVVPAITHGAGAGQYLGRVLLPVSDLDGDGASDLLVGEPGFLAGGRLEEGRILAVSSRDGTVIGVLGNPSPVAFDNFGHALALVDIDGNGTKELAVGAPQRFASTPKLYLFNLGAPGTFTPTNFFGSPTATVQLSVPATADSRLGYSLAAGDVIDDGDSEELIVGQPRVETTHGRDGYAWVYDHHAASGVICATALIKYEANLTGSQAGAGMRVAAIDANGDGVDDIVIGAPYSPGRRSSSLGTTGCIGSPLSVPPGGTEDDATGVVFIVDGTIVPSLGATCPDFYPLGVEMPTITVSLCANLPIDASLQQDVLLFQSHHGGSDPTRDLNAEFGSALSTADLDADGVDETLFIGARKADNGAAVGASGTLWEVDPETTTEAFTLAQLAYRYNGAAADDRFGIEGRIVADLTGDTTEDLAVGASSATTAAGASAGAVFIFERDGSMAGRQSRDTNTSSVSSAEYFASGPSASAQMPMHPGEGDGNPGTSEYTAQANVATVADANCDDVPDLFVGAPYADGAGLDSGAIILFGTPGGSAYISQPAVICGDCDLDGRVSILDALAAALIDAGLYPAPSSGTVQFSQCNVVTPSSITVLDGLEIAKYVIGRTLLNCACQ